MQEAVCLNCKKMSQRTILYISKGLDDPSTRYRALQFSEQFKLRGWKTRHLVDKKSFFNKFFIFQQARQSDVVVVLRRTYSPFFMFLLRLCSKYLVFDFDDAIFCKSSGKESRRRKNGFARMVSRCDLVWTGNSFLAEKAKVFNEHVALLPTSVDVEKYDLLVNKPEDTFDLVWIGSSSTKKHLLTVLPALEEAAEVVPNLRLKIVADFDLQTEKLTVVPVRWSESGEAQELASAHIGIAPLPDNLFTRGKCALKVLQYMAASLPVISSASGVNKDVIENGVSGFLAADGHEWVEAIGKLAGDRSLCQSMGQAGREFCVEHFSSSSVFKTMLASLEQGVVTKRNYK